ncbi:MAG: metal-dependent hydrolase, partial [Wenzhouxiangellaceae bacterium]
MDPVTQGIFGSLFAQAGARAGHMRAAAAAGFVAGLTPDLDVLIRSPADSLLAIEYHRHFTHALSFAPVLATLSALVLWPVVRRVWPDAGFARLWLWSLLGVASHGLLDAMTSYGTRLFWPFSEWRVAWHAVSVIDPLFTLPLALLLGIGLWRRRPALALAAAAWAALYLSSGLIQQQRAEQQVRAWAAGAGIEARRVIAKPSFANLLVWRGLVDDGQRLHVVALRLPPWGTAQHWTGASVQRYTVANPPAGSRLARDLERFRHFSDDWLARD